MIIVLKSFLGDKRVSVDDKAKVKNLRDLVEKNYGIELHEQELRFDDKILDKDENLLKNYNIRNESIIYVIHKSRQVEAHVTMPNDSIFILHVQSENTVSELKSMIQEQSGMSPSEQVILHKGNALNDGNQLLHYKISGLCALKVIPKVTADNKCVILRAGDQEFCTLFWDKETNISGLKKKLTNQTGVKGESVIMKYNNRLLKDNDDFKSLGIQDAFTSFSIENINMILFINLPDGTQLQIEVVPRYQISELKSIIHDRSGLSMGDHVILYKGKMPLDDKTLMDTGIVDRSEIDIKRKHRYPFKIIVKSWDNRSFTIEICNEQNVCDLKQNVFSKTAMNPIEQMLTFHDFILDDDKSLYFYPIVDKSVISLSIRNRGGSQFGHGLKISEGYCAKLFE